MGEPTGFLRVDPCAYEVSHFSPDLNQERTDRQRACVSDCSAGYESRCAIRCSSSHDCRRDGYDVPVRRIVKTTTCHCRYSRSINGSLGKHQGVLAEGVEVPRKLSLPKDTDYQLTNRLWMKPIDYWIWISDPSLTRS
jgi:hypothetical protein